MLVTKTEKKENKFQSALEYLLEYQGVKGAIIFDKEGLVVSNISRDNADPELFSPLALLMIEQTSTVLSRLGEPPVHFLIMKNNESWITIERINDLILVVRAGHDTNELLKVRIGQAVDMVRTYVKENYPLAAR
jgi:predicted regulator of Ras-like GTPase activity (Roadblock/LC7/MglB family)